jgi:hypothetical protein
VKLGRAFWPAITPSVPHGLEKRLLQLNVKKKRSDV